MRNLSNANLFSLFSFTFFGKAYLCLAEMGRF